MRGVVPSNSDVPPTQVYYRIFNCFSEYVAIAFIMAIRILLSEMEVEVLGTI